MQKIIFFSRKKTRKDPEFNSASHSQVMVLLLLHVGCFTQRRNKVQSATQYYHQYPGRYTRIKVRRKKNKKQKKNSMFQDKITTPFHIRTRRGWRSLQTWVFTGIFADVKWCLPLLTRMPGGSGYKAFICSSFFPYSQMVCIFHTNISFILHIILTQYIYKDKNGI